MSVQTWLRDVVGTEEGNERSRGRSSRSDDDEEQTAATERSGRPATDGGDVPSDPIELYMETDLTPAEYVRQLLRDHEGCLKQSEFVAATGWSKSTVSRRLCSLEEEGVVSRVQVGQEKHVFLPETAPDGTGD